MYGSYVIRLKTPGNYKAYKLIMYFVFLTEQFGVMILYYSLSSMLNN